MFTGGIAVGAYVLGRSTQDVRGAEARGVERGKAVGAQQARSDIAKEQEANAASQARSDTIEYLGYDDWKDDRWYAVHMIKRRGGDYAAAITSINDRQLMSPGLDYSLCGDDAGSICYSGR
jgi:hypothetical protein